MLGVHTYESNCSAIKISLHGIKPGTLSMITTTLQKQLLHMEVFYYALFKAIVGGPAMAGLVFGNGIKLTSSIKSIKPIPSVLSSTSRLTVRA